MDISPLRCSVKTNRKEGRKKDGGHSKHSWSVDKTNKEVKLPVAHNANTAVLWGKGLQEQITQPKAVCQEWQKTRQLSITGRN